MRDVSSADGWGLRRAGMLSLVLVAVLAAAASGSAQVAAPWLELTGPASGWLEVPDSPELNPTSAITIEAWVYLRSEAVYGISGCCATFVGKGFAQGYALELASAGTGLRFYARGNLSSVLSQGGLEVGRWNHVAVTYDGSTTRFHIGGVDAVGEHAGSLVGDARITGGTAAGRAFETFVAAGGHQRLASRHRHGR